MFAIALWSDLRLLRRSSWMCLTAITVFVGCSSGPDLPPIAGAQREVPTQNGSTSPQSCADGAQRACSKTLAQQGLTISCYYGTQTCGGGVWSDCAQGTVVLQSAPPRGDRITAAISTPQPCLDNPCDPSCQRYAEVPNAGLTAQLVNNTAWQTGALSSYPTALRNLVSKPNCETAADCQQNQRCVNVVTDTSCSHDKCQNGPSLTNGCTDPCVAKVCAQFPGCCDPNQQLSCQPTEIPSPDGTRCYFFESRSMSWSNARASCQARRANWDLTCIRTQVEEDLINDNGYYTSAWLGLQRVVANDPTSTFACVNGETPMSNGQPAGEQPWNSDPAEPNNYGGSENCVEIYGGSGLWNDQSCSSWMPSWCEGPPSTSVGWSGQCVSAIATVCGATCNSSGTTQPAACQAWSPGQTNPNDAGSDLSLGTPCQGEIPVCNHGTQAAPSGAVVHVLPINPSQIGNSTPDLSAEVGSCATTTAINPGSCVMVAGCSPILDTDAQLWVTLPAGSVEARTDDNWGLNVPNVQCGPPLCLSSSGSGPCFASKTQTYDYQGVCPGSDQVPQWSFLTFDSTTPGDSSIKFSVAAAPSVDLLASEPSVPLVTVSRSAGNESCQLSGPSPKGCPVNLYSALLPNATTSSALLRLTITINPSSDGSQSPVLNDWRISYSCPAGT